MANELLGEISVIEVYDQASDIAKEFDKVITKYGREAITDLMPKVIRTLELLEYLATRFDKDKSEIIQLRENLQKLEFVKITRAQENAKFEQELEVIEENWHSEVKGLLDVVEKLSFENNHLTSALRREKHVTEERLSSICYESEEIEIRRLSQLKENFEKQQEDLRLVKHDLAQKTLDYEDLHSHLEQVVKVNAELHHKYNTHQRQACALLEEKSVLEIALFNKEAEVEKVKAIMSDHEKFEKQRTAVQTALAKHWVDREGIASNGDGDGTHTIAVEMQKVEQNANFDDDGDLGGHLVDSNILPSSNLEGKIIADVKDPSMPQFTIQELQQVLMERSQLKTRLIEVDVELNQYCLRDQTERDGTQPELASYCDTSCSKRYVGDEVPVYGPINNEPYDKLYGYQPSGIRKLFKFLFRRGSSSFEIPMCRQNVLLTPAI